MTTIERMRAAKACEKCESEGWVYATDRAFYDEPYCDDCARAVALAVVPKRVVYMDGEQPGRGLIEKVLGVVIDSILATLRHEIEAGR